MPEFLSAEQAVQAVKDGDCVANGAFLTLLNPMQLMHALGKRYMETSEPKHLTLFSSAGFGDWEECSVCDMPVWAGAVDRVIVSHFSSTPTTCKMIIENKIEGYNLPFGPMVKAVGARAAGKRAYYSNVGKNLFADPKHAMYRLNERSKNTYVTDAVLDGEEVLRYEIPDFDVVFLKGSFSDREGNISFEHEPVVGDPINLAIAARRNGGKVIVQVKGVRDEAPPPHSFILPAFLVDIVAECPEQRQIAHTDEFFPDYIGETPMSKAQKRDYIIAMDDKSPRSLERRIIAQRAARELLPGSVINIGIGVPDGVAIEAARNGILDKITVTVESGPIGGIPASAKAFGSAIAPGVIIPISQMFDLYDGGGLDMTFLGALEVDAQGNVNCHHKGSKLSGIGGFANISQNTPTVVFCLTFSSGGLQISESCGKYSIVGEGRHKKFSQSVEAISFSATNARLSGQRVLYVTERCVFRLGEKGLCLCEIYPGIDMQRDILDQLPFEVEVDI